MDLQGRTFAVWDIETPRITSEGIGAVPEIYCISVVLVIDGVIQPAKLFTQYYTTYSDGSLLEAIKLINSTDGAVAHNGIGFDNAVLRYVCGVDIKVKSYDTLIISKIMLSSNELISIDAKLGLDKKLWGSYSLKAFGERLGESKLEFTDFDGGLTYDMAFYCKQDTVTGAELFVHLCNQPNWPADNVLELEHECAKIIQEQEHYGFYFNIEKGTALNTTLLTEKLEIGHELEKMFKPKFLPDGKVKTYKGTTKSKKFLPNPKYKPLLGTQKWTTNN